MSSPRNSPRRQLPLQPTTAAMESEQTKGQLDKRKNESNNSSYETKRPRLDASKSSSKENEISISEDAEIKIRNEEDTTAMSLQEEDEEKVSDSDSDKLFAEIQKRESSSALNKPALFPMLKSEPISSDNNNDNDSFSPPVDINGRNGIDNISFDPPSQLSQPCSQAQTYGIKLEVYDWNTKKVIGQVKDVKCDEMVLSSICNSLGVELINLHNSNTGYSADISDLEESERQRRLHWTSLGSTIPNEGRFSIATTISKVSQNDSDDSPQGKNENTEKIKPKSVPQKRSRKNREDGEPILNSTKLSEKSCDKLSNGNGTSKKNEIMITKKKLFAKPKSTLSKSSEDTDFRSPISKKAKVFTPKLKIEKGTTSSDITSSELETSIDSPVEDNKKILSDTSVKEEKADNSSSSQSGITPVSNSFEDVDEKTLTRSVTLWGTIGVGEPVFARWRDKNYYSGIISKKGLNDTWHISFEDDMDDVASETHILPVKIIGTGVKAVHSPDSIYVPSTVRIIGQKLENDLLEDKPLSEIKYAISCDAWQKPIYCLRKHLSIMENEAKELRKAYQTPILFKAADVSCENIIREGTRRRVNSDLTGGKKGKKRIVGGAFDSSSIDESGYKTMNTPGSSSMMKTPGSVSSLKTPASSTLSKTPGSSAVVKRKRSSDEGSSKDDSAIISTPKTSNTKDTPKRGRTPKEKLLFEKMQFFLTASGGGDPSSSGNVDTPLSNYDKDELKNVIEKHGGKVILHVGKEKSRDGVFLIADSHARTVKYIYSLAAGIPCVSFIWIQECLQKNEIVAWKEYQLNSGWSLQEEQVIPSHLKKPLKGVKISVLAQSEELYDYWKPVLTAAQAILSKSKKKGGMHGDADVIVTDDTYAKESLEVANKYEIPVVKPEWLVQTIIAGVKVPYNGHEKYLVTLNENPEEEDDDEEDDEEEEEADEEIGN